MLDVAGVTNPVSCLAQVQLWFAPFFFMAWALRGASKFEAIFRSSKFIIFSQFHLLSGSTSPDIVQEFVGSSWIGEWLWQFYQSHPRSSQLKVVATSVGSVLFARCPMQGARDGAILEATTSIACQEPPDRISSHADVARHMLLNVSSTVCETPRHLFQS